MHTQQIAIFGEVLFDHFPDGSRILGGAPFNVAWHLQAFGCSPNFISRIGTDSAGQDISALMDAWGLSRASVQVDQSHPTGSVQVTFQEDEPNYEIVPDSAYDFISSDFLNTELSQGILYHGSLAIRNPIARQALQMLKAKHRGKVFVDVNLRLPWWDKESLFTFLNAANWVKLNQAELELLIPDQSDLNSAMRTFYKQFGLETLVVTRGEQGARALDSTQQFISVYPAETVSIVDTVGAGDAFSSVLLLGLKQQWPLEVALERAQIFASAIVGKRGATVNDRIFYQGFCKQWSLY